MTLAVDKLNHRDYLEFEFRLIGGRLPACQLPTTYGTQQGREPSRECLLRLLCLLRVDCTLLDAVNQGNHKETLNQGYKPRVDTLTQLTD